LVRKPSGSAFACATSTRLEQSSLCESAGAGVVREGTVMEFSHSGYEHFA